MLGADVAEPVRLAISGATRNRDITRAALAELRKDNPDIARMGALLTEQHTVLRDNLGISTPRIEALLEAAMSVGADGGKINGSGGGGCMFACCRDAETAARVARAIAAAGGRAHIINIDTGFREETE
jgi:galactokinase